MLARRHVVEYLISERAPQVLAVAGLGSATWDLSAAGNHVRNFCFIGAMGQAAPFALGLALARRRQRIVLFTGDGDMLMSLGSLAVIANQSVKNLVIVVLDNSSYGETGGQPTATAGMTDLEQIARGAGFAHTTTVSKESELAALRREIHSGEDLHFANIKVQAEKLPLVFPHSFDGVTAINRFRQAVIGEDNAD